jgi:hypothetical protein
MLPTRTADDREHQVLRGLWVGVVRPGDRLSERADRDVGTLVRLQATHEQGEPEPGQMQLRLSLRSVGRQEDRVVDAGGNDPDPLGIGAVQAHELTRLLRRRREDPVGLEDDPLLASEPLGRLRRFPLGERVVLDLAECVERGHQRHAEDLFDRPPDPAR